MLESTTGRGSGGNVLAALASLHLPGLGNCTGRIFRHCCSFWFPEYFGFYPLGFSGG